MKLRVSLVRVGLLVGLMALTRPAFSDTVTEVPVQTDPIDLEMELEKLKLDLDQTEKRMAEIKREYDHLAVIKLKTAGSIDTLNRMKREAVAK